MMRGLSTAVLVLLAGCSLDPRYTRPVAPVPPGFPAGAAYPPLPAEAAPLAWRTLFRDAALQAIVDQALTSNRDLRVALANVEVARQQYRIQRAEQFPQVGVDGGVTRSRSSSAGVPTGVGTGTTTGGAGAGSGVGAGSGGGGTGMGTGTVVSTGGRNRTIYNAGITLAAFEIDLFGRLRSLSRAAFNDYLATGAGARSSRLAIVAGVAEAYYQLAADRSALGVAQRTVASAERSVRLTDQRRAGGVAPRTDVDQARTVLETARADVADYTARVAQDRNALDLIAGAPVAEALLPASIEAVDGLIGEVPAGLSSTVLLRRPDVVEAELQLLAANARSGAARAAFFPTISLTAAAGFTSTALSSLFSDNAFQWSAGPGVSLPIFDGGARSANLGVAKASRDVAMAQYERAIQVAFREVADALARRGTIDAQLAAVRANTAAAADNYRLSEARYREGVDNFLLSLDAQRTLYAAQQRLAVARQTRAVSLVTLYQALGGDELTDPDRSALPTPR